MTGGPAELNLTGVVAASITPFKDDESLDLGRLESHLDFLIDGGCGAILVLGGAGEYVNLSRSEREAVTKAAVAAVGGRVPIIVGALAPSTREVLEMAEFSARAGADALLALPPYYIRTSTAGIVEHFRQLAAGTGMPVIAYNQPGRIVVSMSLETLGELADIPGVIAVKDCDRDLAALQLKLERLADRMNVISGDEDLGFYTILAGATCGIWATPNLAPWIYVELFEACAAGDLERARSLQSIILALVSARQGPNHPGPLKEMMAMVGRPAGPGRRPLMPMTESERNRAAGILARHADLLRGRPADQPQRAKTRALG
jgi:4-hydroxy-tetrahydrodipicolinate synthase